MDDLEFVQSCIKGDERALDEFINRYSRLIYHYIHSVLKVKGQAFAQENISDLFQEIFLSLVKDNFKKLSTFKAKNGCSLASWLRLVTINFTIDYIRKSKASVSIDEERDDNLKLIETLSSDGPSAKEILSHQERIKDLEDCIDKLENEDKYFLELHYHRNLGLEELKDFFKISRGAIDMRKSRIVERLRGCFKDKGFHFDDK